MIYVDNDSTYSQRVFIPREEELNSGVTGHTFALQSKDYDISGNGAYKIHPDAGFDGISGGTIAVYVTAATSITPEHLDVTEDGIYVPTGDSVYTGITVQVYDRAYQDGFQDGYSSGQTDGYASGHTDGYNDGYASGYTIGHTDGYNEGYYSGSTNGFESGYNEGYGVGYSSGYTSGSTDGYVAGKQDGYSAGYTSGSTDGYAEGFQIGYASGYTEGRAEGYAEGYASGLTDGAAAQKALMTAETFTQNGEYTRENGWSAVTIQINDGPYNEGYQDGIDHQKSLLGSVELTANNQTVTSETGYSAVTTNLDMRTLLPRLTHNGVFPFYAVDYNYAGFNGVEITVDVPTSGGSAVLTAVTAYTNGVYTPDQGIDGFSSVRVDVDTASTYNAGYASGYTSGYTSGMTDGYSSGYTEGGVDQKALLSSTALTTNGTFNRENGWSAVTVNVPTAATYNSGYTSGYTDGTNYQKSMLGSTAFTANGNYTNANGWSAVTVNMDTASTYNEGFTSGRTRGFSEGVAAQKALLSTTAITENGSYTRANGWSGVTVNVPLTTLNVTTNGTYTASSGGYNNVTVNVPQTPTIVTMTQAQYNALSTKDNNTIYLIKN